MPGSKKYTGKCGAIISRGPRTGQPCGVGCCASVGRCTKHIGSRVVPSGVTWIHKMPSDVVELILTHKREGEWADGFMRIGWSTGDVVEQRDLALLRWAVKKGCPWDRITTLRIARAGDLEMLRFAVENGCREFWHPETLQMLISEHPDTPLEGLKWMVENGCPWHHITTLKLIEARRFHQLKWVVAEGRCPWHVAALNRIVATGDRELLVWALDNNLPMTN